MKMLMTLASVVLLAASTVQAGETWRAAQPRLTPGTAVGEARLPLVQDTGIVPTDDAGPAPLVRTSQAASGDSSRGVPFMPVSTGGKSLVAAHADSSERYQVNRVIDEPVAVVPAALVNTPLVGKASYVRPISEAEMMGTIQTVSEVQPAARLEPVATAAVPATVAPSTSYYPGATTVYQPVATVANPCDPCAACNPCQTYVATPVTTYQPVAACPTGVCKQPTLRPGLWGQPSVHIAGQPIRNAIRWLVP